MRLVHKPSFREKKRYMLIEVLSSHDKKQVEDAIISSALSLLGELGLSKAGIDFILWQGNKAVVKVNRAYINHLRALLAITKENGMLLRSLKTSGAIANVKN